MVRRTPDQMVVSIPAGRRAPGAAREAVEEVLDGSPQLGDALLVTSELIANTVLHSGLEEDEPIRLVVSRRADRIRIGVSHRRPGRSRRPGDRRPERRQGGFGLRIVAEVARRWDVEHRGDTTETWFEL